MGTTQFCFYEEIPSEHFFFFFFFLGGGGGGGGVVYNLDV